MHGASAVIPQDTAVALSGQLEAHGRPKVLAAFTCAICQAHSFGDPVVTPCEHLYHGDCLRRALDEDPRCPTCRTPVAEKDVKPAPSYVRSALEAADVQCPQQGCDTICQFAQLKAHVTDSCAFTLFRCDSQGCDVEGKRTTMAEHVSDCPHAFVDCEDCEKSVKRQNMRAHLQQRCPRRRITCDRCGAADVMYCQKGKHMRRCTGAARMEDIAELKQLVRKQGAQIARLQAERSRMQKIVSISPAAPSVQVGLLRLLLNIPLRIVVTCPELSYLSGTYALTPAPLSGNAVWAMGHARVFKNQRGYWMITSTVKSIKYDYGEVGSKEPTPDDCCSPTDVDHWTWDKNSNCQWFAAWNTTVAAVNESPDSNFEESEGSDSEL
eukprot:TRINITY_DN40407_c0_g1_i1.p1 TRINITY_DN40407_c0_g1~~TRINITY_DN40407_c0_g1_i1.p1  ORF type:complete len:409 (+),score=129.85 TRINITY_DN40407_c0_g1_i1:87-1229(+)